MLRPSAAAKEESVTKPKVVFSPVSQEFFENPYEIYARIATTHRCTTTSKRTSTR